MTVTLGMGLGLLGAAIAFSLSATGAGIAMGMAGQAAAGVLKEDPRKFGQTLVLQAIGTTGGIYGLLMAFLIMQKSLTLGDNLSAGIWLLAAGIPMGIVGLFASIAQGRALVAGIILIGKRPSELAKALIYAAMIETLSVFALLISFLMYNSI